MDCKGFKAEFIHLDATINEIYSHYRVCGNAERHKKEKPHPRAFDIFLRVQLKELDKQSFFLFPCFLEIPFSLGQLHWGSNSNLLPNPNCVASTKEYLNTFQNPGYIICKVFILWLKVF